MGFVAQIIPLEIFDGVLRPLFDLRTKTSPALTEASAETGRTVVMCKSERNQALRHHLEKRIGGFRDSVRQFVVFMFMCFGSLLKCIHQVSISFLFLGNFTIYL